jgi:hypothetical protein
MTDNQLTSQPKSHRGFAAMDPARQRELARRGGRAAHERGTAHEFSPEEARRAGQRGGAVVSRDRQHMATIGSRGGRNRGNSAAQAANQANQAATTAAGAQAAGSTAAVGSERESASTPAPSAPQRQAITDDQASGRQADADERKLQPMRRTPRSREAHGVEGKSADGSAEDDEQGS